MEWYGEDARIASSVQSSKVRCRPQQPRSACAKQHLLAHDTLSAHSPSSAPSLPRVSCLREYRFLFSVCCLITVGYGPASFGTACCRFQRKGCSAAATLPYAGPPRTRKQQRRTRTCNHTCRSSPRTRQVGRCSLPRVPNCRSCGHGQACFLVANALTDELCGAQRRSSRTGGSGERSSRCRGAPCSQPTASPATPAFPSTRRSKDAPASSIILRRMLECVWDRFTWMRGGCARRLTRRSAQLEHFKDRAAIYKHETWLASAAFLVQVTKSCPPAARARSMVQTHSRALRRQRVFGEGACTISEVPDEAVQQDGPGDSNRRSVHRSTSEATQTLLSYSVWQAYLHHGTCLSRC